MRFTRPHSANIMADTEQCFCLVLFLFGVSFNSFLSPIVKEFVITVCVSQSVGDVIATEHEAINHDQELKFQQR